MPLEMAMDNKKQNALHLFRKDHKDYNRDPIVWPEIRRTLVDETRDGWLAGAAPSTISMERSY